MAVVEIFRDLPMVIHEEGSTFPDVSGLSSVFPATDTFADGRLALIHLATYEKSTIGLVQFHFIQFMPLFSIVRFVMLSGGVLSVAICAIILMLTSVKPVLVAV